MSITWAQEAGRAVEFRHAVPMAPRGIRCGAAVDMLLLPYCSDRGSSGHVSRRSVFSVSRS